MHAFIGDTLLTSDATHPRIKPFEIFDSRLPGFTLRVPPSGYRSYYARYGRSRRIVLGNVESLTPQEARERCRKVLGNVVHGNHPLHGIQGSEGMTLCMFIADAYTTRINASRPRTAANTLENALSSVLRRAVKAGELSDNPVRRVDKPRIDRRG